MSVWKIYSCPLETTNCEVFSVIWYTIQYNRSRDSSKESKYFSNGNCALHCMYVVACLFYTRSDGLLPVVQYLMQCSAKRVIRRCYLFTVYTYHSFIETFIYKLTKNESTSSTSFTSFCFKIQKCFGSRTGGSNVCMTFDCARPISWSVPLHCLIRKHAWLGGRIWMQHFLFQHPFCSHSNWLNRHWLLMYKTLHPQLSTTI